MAELQKKATRESYGETLRDLAEKYPELVVLDADLAAALFNMIYENVGVMASLALSRDTTRNVVLTGSLASLAPAAKTFDIFNQMHDVFGIDYIIPPHPSFATAVGALLCDPLPEN